MGDFGLMAQEITVTVLAERVHQYHAAVLQGQKVVQEDIKEIKDNLLTINGHVHDHGERIARVEGKQGILTKIIFSSIGVSGLGAIVTGASKAAGLW